MTDIVIKTILEFKEIYNKNTVSYEIYDKKYEELFSKYECFTSKNINALYIKDIKQRGNGYHNYNTKPRDKQIKKPLEKIILGILNIINLDNYNKMINKLRILSTKDTISIIINDVLLKCCSQPFYLKIFVRLMSDLIATSGYKEIIVVEIYKFITLFMLEDEYILKNKDNIKDYDLFCLQQKHKLYILGKINLIIALVKDNIIFLQISEIIFYIFENLKNIENDEYHYDILLQILIIMYKNKLKCSEEIHNELLLYLECDINVSKKIEFMTKELIELVYSS
jgi:hypothetical protein